MADPIARLQAVLNDPNTPREDMAAAYRFLRGMNVPLNRIPGTAEYAAQDAKLRARPHRAGVEPTESADISARGVWDDSNKALSVMSGDMANAMTLGAWGAVKPQSSRDAEAAARSELQPGGIELASNVAKATGYVQPGGLGGLLGRAVGAGAKMAYATPAAQSLATAAGTGAGAGAAESAFAGNSAEQVVEDAAAGSAIGGLLAGAGEGAGAARRLLRKGDGQVARYMRAKDRGAYETEEFRSLPSDADRMVSESSRRNQSKINETLEARNRAAGEAYGQAKESISGEEVPFETLLDGFRKLRDRNSTSTGAAVNPAMDDAAMSLATKYMAPKMANSDGQALLPHIRSMPASDLLLMRKEIDARIRGAAAPAEKMVWEELRTAVNDSLDEAAASSGAISKLRQADAAFSTERGMQRRANDILYGQDVPGGHEGLDRAAKERLGAATIRRAGQGSVPALDRAAQLEELASFDPTIGSAIQNQKDVMAHAATRFGGPVEGQAPMTKLLGIPVAITQNARALSRPLDSSLAAPDLFGQMMSGNTGLPPATLTAPDLVRMAREDKEREKKAAKRLRAGGR